MATTFGGFIIALCAFLLVVLWVIRGHVPSGEELALIVALFGASGVGVAAADARAGRRADDDALAQERLLKILSELEARKDAEPKQ